MRRVSVSVVKRLALLALCAALTFWLGSLAACEYLSWRYGDAFRTILVHDIGGERFLTEETIKVLSCDAREAAVYTLDAYGGDFYHFRKDTSGRWVNTGWDTVWSASGNADKYVFPYLRLEGFLGGRYKWQ